MNSNLTSTYLIMLFGPTVTDLRKAKPAVASKHTVNFIDRHLDCSTINKYLAAGIDFDAIELHPERGQIIGCHIHEGIKIVVAK